MAAAAADLDVCLLTTGFPRFPGDTFGTFVLELARALRVQGLRVGVLAPHEAGLARHEVVDGVEVSRFGYFPGRWQRLAYGGGMPTNLRSSWLARLQVPVFLAAFVLHGLRMARRSRLLHCQWTISGLVGYLATRLVRRPVVLTVRGSDVHLAGGVGARLNRFVYRRMAAVVAVSHDLAQRLQSAGAPAGRVQVITNGVDERFRPGDRDACRRQLDLPGEGLILLFVGLLVPVKGLGVLLDALERIAAAAWTCVLVGDGQEREMIAARVGDGALAGRVRLAGRQPASDIPAWMGAADLFVLPSFSEGRPNVVLEAQACGLPVVASAVGGTPELIDDEHTGLLVPAGDAEALAAALRRLVDDDGLRRRLGEGGRRHVVDGGFSWASTATRTRALYADVLGAA